MVRRQFISWDTMDTSLRSLTRTLNSTHQTSTLCLLTSLLMRRRNRISIPFFHLDLGEKYVDHHCFFLVRAPLVFLEARMHHTSYEVDDFDTQLIGYDWLLRKNYKVVWGVGRHILGSQIFDYWRDPSGFTIEHYADGDVIGL